MKKEQVVPSLRVTLPVWTTPPGAVSRVPPASLPDHLAQAGLQIGGLAVRGAPAALAGLQDKEELAIGVGLLQASLAPEGRRRGPQCRRAGAMTVM